MHLTFCFSAMFPESFGFEKGQHILAHLRVSTQENLCIFRFRVFTPCSDQITACPEILNISGQAAPGHGLVGGAADQRQIGQIAAELLHHGQFRPVTQIPGMPDTV